MDGKKKGKSRKGSPRNVILAEVLRASGMTQRDLADLAGVSQSTVGAMLACDERMLPKSRAKIARAIGALVGPIGKPVSEAPSVLHPGQTITLPCTDGGSAVHDADAVAWKPRYWHEPTGELVDLGPKMELAEALAVAAAASDDRGVRAEVHGPAVLAYAPETAEAE